MRALCHRHGFQPILHDAPTSFHVHMGRFPSFVAEEEDSEPVSPQHRWHAWSSASAFRSCPARVCPPKPLVPRIKMRRLRGIQMLERNLDAVHCGFEPLVAKVPQKIPERSVDIFAVKHPSSSDPQPQVFPLAPPGSSRQGRGAFKEFGPGGVRRSRTSRGSRRARARSRP